MSVDISENLRYTLFPVFFPLDPNYFPLLLVFPLYFIFNSLFPISLLNTFSCKQGRSQDLETRCPKLAIVKFLGVQISKGYHNILMNISTININEFIKTRHNGYSIHIQYHGNHMEGKKFNYMLEINILRNSSQIFLGVLSPGAF